MAYNPNMYMPYGQQSFPQAQPNWSYQPQQVTAQPVNGLVSVTGIEGAKAYQLPPNSCMPLFDSDADFLYLKTTDAGGFPTVRAFRFEPVENPASGNETAPAVEYATKADIDALRYEIDALKHPAASKSTRTVSRKAADDGE